MLAQIDALSKDASYNGINLLNGDTLKVVFNEAGTSNLVINGVTFDAAGLGLTTVQRHRLPDQLLHRRPHLRPSIRH